MLKALSALGAVVAASVLFIPTASLAASGLTAIDDETVSTTVSYADLNLASARDASALMHRINDAAKTVCGTPYSFEIFVSPERRVCINGAVASAQPAFEAAVAAAHRGTVTVTYGASLIVSAPRQ
jgi:UrcA family protein